MTNLLRKRLSVPQTVLTLSKFLVLHQIQTPIYEYAQTNYHDRQLLFYESQRDRDNSAIIQEAQCHRSLPLL